MGPDPRYSDSDPRRRITLSQDEAFISIRDVSKSFGPVKAVDHVSMEIGRGEFFSLLGPSGCGKTTLLRMLAGFEAPTSGEIIIDGQPMSAVPPHQRPVNMVFQSYAIFPHLNVCALSKFASIAGPRYTLGWRRSDFAGRAIDAPASQ